jgi:hypothetical protein
MRLKQIGELLAQEGEQSPETTKLSRRETVIRIAQLYESGVRREDIGPRFGKNQIGVVNALHEAYHGPQSLKIRAEIDRRKAEAERAEQARWRATNVL